MIFKKLNLWEGVVGERLFPTFLSNDFKKLNFWEGVVGERFHLCVLLRLQLLFTFEKKANKTNPLINK
jgi:hypothetical protein